MRRQSRKRRLELADLKSGNEEDLLGEYRPPAAEIDSFEQLFRHPVPEWDAGRPAAKLDFFSYLQRAELLLNGLLLKLISAPDPTVVVKFAEHREFFAQLQKTLTAQLDGNYQALREIDNRGNLIFASKAVLISVVAAKAGYLAALLEALGRAQAARPHRRRNKLLLFEAPFLRCDVFAPDAETAPEFRNGDALVPRAFSVVPRLISPYLYEQDCLFYPDLVTGSFTQAQLMLQVSALAEAWDRLDLLSPGIPEFLDALSARFMELQTLSFGAESPELDMGEHDRRPEPHRGLHREAPSIQKQLQFGHKGLDINDSCITKEVRKLKKRQTLCCALSLEYQIRMLGMFVALREDVRFAQTELLPRLAAGGARQHLAGYVVAALLRYAGGAELLLPAGPRPAAHDELLVPNPHGSEEGLALGFPEDVLEDYGLLYGAMRQTLLDKQRMPIDDTTKRRLCEAMRLMQIPYGSAEVACLGNRLHWSTARKDWEDAVVPKGTQTYQMTHWEGRPIEYFLSARRRLTHRLVMAEYIIDAIASSHAVQERQCSKDLLVMSHVLDVGELRGLCHERRLPFVLQFGCELFLFADKKFFLCRDIVEAFMIWFLVVYSRSDGAAPERGAKAEVRLGYLEYVIGAMFHHVPEQVISRYKRYVQQQQARRAGVLEHDAADAGEPEPEHGDDIYDLINSLTT